MRLLLASLTVFTAATLAACGGANETPKSSEVEPSAEPAEPEAVTVVGELQLMDGVEELYDSTGYNETGECIGIDGYSDVNEGAQVTVYDASGEALALGNLEKGLYDVDGEYVVPCMFTFEVADVPVDGNVFAIEVSHRGKVNFTRDQLADYVTLTLGE